MEGGDSEGYFQGSHEQTADPENSSHCQEESSHRTRLPDWNSLPHSKSQRDRGSKEAGGAFIKLIFRI